MLIAHALGWYLVLLVRPSSLVVGGLGVLDCIPPLSALLSASSLFPLLDLP